MKALVTMVFLISANALLSWGPTGHRVIGKVAENNLSRKAAREVNEILRGESLAEASTWMDEIRSDDRYDHTHSWHYTTIPDGLNYANRDNDQGQLVEKIEEMINLLEDESTSDSLEVMALKFLVHLVGDLHQPLHVGNGQDRGGNDVRVKFFYEPSNLHRVWDSGMINHKLYSYSELAAIIDRADDAETENWLKGTAADWANECLQYRKQIYDIENPDRLGYEYVYRNWDLLEQQLLKGGLRLAGILNSIYS